MKKKDRNSKPYARFGAGSIDGILYEKSDDMVNEILTFVEPDVTSRNTESMVEDVRNFIVPASKRSMAFEMRKLVEPVSSQFNSKILKKPAEMLDFVNPRNGFFGLEEGGVPEVGGVPSVDSPEETREDEVLAWRTSDAQEEELDREVDMEIPKKALCRPHVPARLFGTRIHFQDQADAVEAIALAIRHKFQSYKEGFGFDDDDDEDNDDGAKKEKELPDSTQRDRNSKNPQILCCFEVETSLEGAQVFHWTQTHGKESRERLGGVPKTSPLVSCWDSGTSQKASEAQVIDIPQEIDVTFSKNSRARQSPSAQSKDVTDKTPNREGQELERTPEDESGV
jgi:hypothetical protein